MSHFLEELILRFPRLAEVSMGRSDKDEYTVEATPAGPVETVYFYERGDFENAVTALAYKLEPRPIPKSMGAIFINGLVDHVKEEKVSMVILSRGGYSGITADMLKDECGMCGRTMVGIEAFGKDASGNDNGRGYAVDGITEEKWDELSLSIRKNHELAHFVQRQLFPENKDPLLDEIKADMVGIIETFGVYDGFLARLFLGIEGPEYRKGGRLENYISEADDIAKVSAIAESYIASLEHQIDTKYQNASGFDILILIESKTD